MERRSSATVCFCFRGTFCEDVLGNMHLAALDLCVGELFPDAGEVFGDAVIIALCAGQCLGLKVATQVSFCLLMPMYANIFAGTLSISLINAKSSDTLTFSSQDVPLPKI